MKLLLLSNSKIPNQPVLEHALPWIRDHFKGARTILFIPYALGDHDRYATFIISAFDKIGIKVISAHTSENPVELLDQVDGIFIGGGNTFRLLCKLRNTGLIEAISEKVKAGMPYMGSSAGTNVACPTIKTTNDMPIVFPFSFDALNLVNFQINPHYLDPDPTSNHMGETREERIMQFHEENSTPVIGIREGTALKITNGNIELLGHKTARVFQKGQPAIEVEPGIVKLDC